MAIKVSGTDVITDGRALNNITSIDTTTKNAIGNAGVGGATSLIQGYTSAGSSTAVTFNLNHGYDVYFLSLYNARHSDSGARELLARLGNSSGSLISTANHYNGTIYDNSAQTFKSEPEFHFVNSAQWQPSSLSGEVDMHIRLENMENSNRRTFIQYTGVFRYTSGGTQYISNSILGHATARVAEVNKNISFFTFGSYTISNLSYELWGVNY